MEPSEADLHRAALDWAAAVRADRTTLAERLTSGACSLEECLDSAPTSPWGVTNLLFVLESLPGARKSDTRRALSRLGVDGDVAVGDLTAADRARLLAEFPLVHQQVSP